MREGRPNINVLPITPALDVPTFDDLKFAVKARAPIWGFDIDFARIIWANDAALSVWQAPDLDTLSIRNLGRDMSPTVRARLQQFQTGFWRGDVFDEIWTIFPNGKATTLACRFRGCLLKNGAMAMLCEGQELADAPQNWCVPRKH